MGILEQFPPVVIIGTAIVGFVIALAFLIGFRRSHRDSILMVGPSSSGKTVLYHQLKNGQFVDTHTSQRENDDTFVLHGEQAGAKPVQVVDYPGHPRLRAGLARHLAKTAGIVFVIDTAEFKKSIRDAADFLYFLLADRVLAKAKVPVLVACNKSDMRLTFTGADEVKQGLETEMHDIRSTRSGMQEAQLAGDRSQDDDELFLGVEGQRFSFDDVVNSVTFAEISAKSGDIRYVTDFVRTIRR